MSATKEKSTTNSVSHNAYCSVIGAAVAGAIEMLAFYPVEVASRRLEANKFPIHTQGMPFRQAYKNFASTVLGGSRPVSFLGYFTSMFSGFKAAVSYRVVQRGYKYGGQPLVKQLLDNYIGDYYRQWFGNRQARIMLDGTAGLCIGTFEAPFLLPLDAVKVRMQVNRSSVNGQGMVKFMLSQGFQLYRGLGITMMRNAIGASSFFAAYATVRENMTAHSYPDAHLTTMQKLSASAIATMISITLSHPLDVIKTRLQSGLEAKNKSGLQVAAEMLRHEGMFSLWKGYFLKIPTAGPRVVFTYALAQTISEALVEWADTKVHTMQVDEPVAEQSQAPKASR